MARASACSTSAAGAGTGSRRRTRPEGESDGGKEEILERFAGWHYPVRAIVEATPAEAILRNDVYYRPPATLERGLRDVARRRGPRFHPGLGQGAAQAIEDAVVLARCLEAVDDVSVALREYEARRRPRTELIQKLSRRLDRAAQLDSALGCMLRDVLARRMPERTARRQSEQILDARL